MKKIMMLFLGAMCISFSGISGVAQQDSSALARAVSRLDKAETVEDFQQLESEFSRMATAEQTDWRPSYYAAFCNAKIGFLYQRQGERIEPFSKRGEQQIKTALSLLDTLGQKKETAEVYVVLSMVYRTKVFINPMTYGRKYGVLSQRYLEKAKQLNPDNPRAIYLEAWVKYNTPKMWGGDKKLGRKLAEEALQKLQNHPAGAAPHWGKKECEQLIK